MMGNATHQQITIAIAALPIVAGGVSASPALPPLPISRTITNGALGFLGGGDGKAP
jgi:hypothetical protein